MNDSNHLEGNVRDSCNTETEQCSFSQQGWDSAEAIEDATCNRLTQSPGYISSGPVGDLTTPLSSV